MINTNKADYKNRPFKTPKRYEFVVKKYLTLIVYVETKFNFVIVIFIPKDLNIRLQKLQDS